jgi:hypothetical protein
MTLDEALSKAIDIVDAFITKAMDDGADMLRSKGATAAELKETMDWYAAQVAAEREKMIAQLNSFVVAQHWRRAAAPPLMANARRPSPMQGGTFESFGVIASGPVAAGLRIQNQEKHSRGKNN